MLCLADALRWSHWSRDRADLAVAASATWCSITEPAASPARTAPRLLLRCEWLLPGHGDRRHLPADESTRRPHTLADRTARLAPCPARAPSGRLHRPAPVTHRPAAQPPSRRAVAGPAGPPPAPAFRPTTRPTTHPPDRSPARPLAESLHPQAS
ncbi:MBL fold metallo-hydrolase [Kitasatospora fiedleri]|uniref:hypothetical protein n=1 Tax=Kitasatospora fiedleri TaxID=2991545 RepID=UPI002989DE79|nr:hypothetical protein [Kitasatospora fiedleri]